MADETIVEEQKIEAPQPSFSDNLRSSFFDEATNAPKEETKIDDKKDDIVKADDKEEILEPKDWLKREFDVDDPGVLKAEREELKGLREKSKQYEFSEDQLKTLDYIKPENEEKLFDFLQTKRRVEKLISGEVTEQNAADIVKFQMQQKYGTLSPEDIDYKFNRQYGIQKEPKEPQEDKFVDTDAYEQAKEKYQEDKQDWEQAVKQAKSELLIDAKMAIPEIQKLKSELNLVDIQREPIVKNPTQEDLIAIKKNVDYFMEFAKSKIDGFTGFSAQVKDKDVDFTSSYAPSIEEKAIVSKSLQIFAESNFDTNLIFAERWVNQDGSYNVDQMTEDLLRIFVGKNSDQKLVTDASNKRLESYLKDKKQIDLKETDVQHKPNLDGKTMSDKLRESFFN